MTTSLTYRHPKELRLHPAQKGVPAPDLESDAWHAFLAGLAEAGPEGIPPAFITEDGQIMDGGWRWRAAKQLKWDRLACIVRPPSEAATLVVNSLLQRKHYTRSALAYLAYPLMQEAHQEAIGRQCQNLLNTPNLPKSPQGTSARTTQDLASELGIGRNLFFEAAKVHKLFEEHPEYKAQMEPRILAISVGGEHESQRPVGLGGVIAGFHGGKEKKPQGGKPEPSRQLELFAQTFTDLGHRYKYWTAFDDDTKRAAGQKMRKAMESMPDDLLDRFAKDVKSEVKRRKLAAKQGVQALKR